MLYHEYLSHTADIGILCRAEPLEGIFSEALKALCDLLKPDSQDDAFFSNNLDRKISLNFKIESDTTCNLLVEFLSYCLLEMNIKKALFSEVKFLQFSQTEIKFELIGYKVPCFSRDVKAITYHESYLKEIENGIYESFVIIDI